MAARRTRKRKSVRKDAHMNIRCTVEQRNIISAAAMKAGLTASSWVLILALREAKNAGP